MNPNEQVIETVGEFTGLSPEQITSKSRVQEIADARALAMYFMSEESSKLVVAMYFGTDKGLVNYSIRKINKIITTKTQPVFSCYQKIKSALEKN